MKVMRINTLNKEEDKQKAYIYISSDWSIHDYDRI